MADRIPGDSVSVTDRATHEAALAEVEETLLNIEVAVRRAERAEAALRAGGAPSKLVDAIAASRRELVAVRKRLQQSAYLAAEESGMYAAQLAMFESPRPTLTSSH